VVVLVAVQVNLVVRMEDLVGVVLNKEVFKVLVLQVKDTLEAVSVEEELEK
jgi:uncharacterized protein (DUF697 family)